MQELIDVRMALPLAPARSSPREELAARRGPGDLVAQSAVTPLMVQAPSAPASIGAPGVPVAITCPGRAYSPAT